MLTRNPVIFFAILDSVAQRHRAVKIVSEREAALARLKQLLRLGLIGVGGAIIFVSLSTYEDIVGMVCLKAARGHIVVWLAVRVDAL